MDQLVELLRAVQDDYVEEANQLETENNLMIAEILKMRQQHRQLLEETSREKREIAELEKELLETDEIIERLERIVAGQREELNRLLDEQERLKKTEDDRRDARKDRPVEANGPTAS